MVGYVPDAALVVVEPLAAPPHKGQVVLTKVAGRQYLHLVSAVNGGLVQISNAKGRVNGWTLLKNVFGLCVSVDGAPASWARPHPCKPRNTDND